MSTSRRRKRGADEPIQNDDDQSMLADLGDQRAPSAEQADRYSQWASRLRDKRDRDKEHIAQAMSGGSGAEQPNYWQSEDVYRETRRIEQEASHDRPNAIDVSAALAVLDLPSSADSAAIDARYRELAKLHHPDRHQSLDEDSQAFHAQQFRAVNEARRVLRAIT